MSPYHFARMSVFVLIQLFLSTNTLSAQDAFVTLWKTDNFGTTNDNQIHIPATGTYEIYWEEHGNPANNGSQSAQDEITITFPSIGVYKVDLSGGLESLKFNLQGDRRKIISIEEWGDINWSSMHRAFLGCTNLNYNATDTPDLTSVTDCTYMFGGCTNINGNFNIWDTSNIKNMSWMFSGCGNFNSSIGNWNTSSVTTMRSMFSAARTFNKDISQWDVSSVEDMTDMFGEAEFFNQNIGQWDVSSVEDMSYMFNTAYEFNQDIGGWNVSSVEDMGGMFFDAESFDQNLGNWDISSVSDVHDMFDYTNLSVLNYDAILIAWSSQDVVDNLTLGAEQAYFCAGETARELLITQQGWNIQDQGLPTDCDPNSYVINAKNSGPGSLRNAIDNAMNHAIYYSPAMKDSTTVLENEFLTIKDSLIIFGVPNGTSTIDGSLLSEIFYIQPSAHHLSLSNLTLLIPNESGLITAPSSLFNLSISSLQLVLPSNSLPLQIFPTIDLSIQGNVEFRKN